jgi:hypothetical protein
MMQSRAKNRVPASHGLLVSISILFGFVLVPAGQAPASILTQIDWVSNVAGQGTFVPVLNSSTDNGFVSVADPLGADLGFASGQTDYGVHRAVVDTESYMVGPLTFQSVVTVRSRWDDTITISGGVGQATGTVFVEIDGTLSSSGSNPSHQASAELLASFGGPAMGWQDNARLCPHCPVVSNATLQDGILSAPFLFTYGQAISIFSHFNLVGSFGGDGHFGNTLTTFFDLPEGASIGAASGALYNIGRPQSPVALPASLLLIATSLGLLMVIRRSP